MGFIRSRPVPTLPKTQILTLPRSGYHDFGVGLYQRFEVCIGPDWHSYGRAIPLKSAGFELVKKKGVRHRLSNLP